MKRNERNNYNHIARDIRKNGIESIINIEVPTNYTHEARQAFHELLTAYNLRAVCIYWNDIEKTWALHYEPARYPEAHDEKRRQEAEDVDAVTARMTRRNWTWNGYPAPAAEAEQQPTETENAPQAATQAAEGTDEEKEAETMTTTEREALERINARQNAANHFTNIGPADIAAELAAMEAEQAAPAPDPDAATLAPADAAQVWDEDGNTITTEQTTTNEQKEEDKTMSNTTNELQKYVDGIAADLRKLYEADPTDEEREAAEENGDACDLYSYFEDVLDIEYTISSRGDYLGARIAVALGGPNIYIDTREGEVKGYWGTDRAERWIPSEICEEIDSIMEEYYSIVRGA